MAVSDSQRRILARFKPAADHGDARRAAWLRDHRLPGEGLASALRRREMFEAPRCRARLASDFAIVEFSRSHFALMRGRYDDGLHDDEFCDSNPRRAYRIRSVRPSDNAWWFVTAPAVLVVDTLTHESLFVPPTGWPVPAHDADAWGAMIFAARDAHEQGERS